VRPCEPASRLALAGWLRPLALRYGIPYAALRGFSSDGFQFDAAEEWRDLGKPVVVIYAGDFDPSGWTIATDLEAHLRYFYERVTVQHIGLHSRQIRTHALPPSFEAKKSASRTPAFVRQFGAQCTELDAVPPNILQQRNARQTAANHCYAELRTGSGVWYGYKYIIGEVPTP